MPTSLIVEGFTISLGFSSRNYFVDEKVLRGIGGGNIGFSIVLLPIF